MEYNMMRSQFLGSLRLRGDNASSSKYSLEYFPVLPATEVVVFNLWSANLLQFLV